jgi:hypothetical protein
MIACLLTDFLMKVIKELIASKVVHSTVHLIVHLIVHLADHLTVLRVDFAEVNGVISKMIFYMKK